MLHSGISTPSPAPPGGMRRHGAGIGLLDLGEPIADGPFQPAPVVQVELGPAVLREPVVRGVADELVPEPVRVAAQGRGSGRSALVIGGRGKMGRWMADFLASQGFRITIADPAGDSSSRPAPSSRRLPDADCPWSSRPP